MSGKKKSTQRRRLKLSDNAVAASISNSPDKNYRVGPGNPPKEYQFKPGQSGNPRGAKRKSKLALDLKAELERALNEKVKLRRGEKEQLVTKFAAGMDKLANQLAEGDHRARRDLLVFADQLGLELRAAQSTNAVIDDTAEAQLRQALLDRGIPSRLLPPIDDAGLEPPPNPPLPPDEDESGQ